MFHVELSSGISFHNSENNTHVVNFLRNCFKKNVTFSRLIFSQRQIVSLSIPSEIFLPNQSKHQQTIPNTNILIFVLEVLEGS